MESSPTQQTWQILCDLVERADEDVLDELLLPYALSHLARWPQALRVAPRGWCARAADGHLRDQRCLLLATRWSLRGSSRVKPALLDAWIKAHPWTHLRSLTLLGAVLSGAALRRALDQPLPHLTHLLAAKASLGVSGVEALSVAPLPALTSLALSQEYQLDAGLLPMAQLAPWWSSLRDLSLRECALSYDTLLRLAERGALGALARLDLSANRLSGELGGWLEAASSASDLGLELLNLTEQSVCAVRLGRALRAPMARLAMGSNELTARALEHLLHELPCQSLTCLELDDNPLGDDAIEVLLRSPCAQTLERLTLRQTQLTERGLLTLARRADELPALRALRLDTGAFSPHGRQAFAAHPTLRAALEAAGLTLA